MNYFIYKTTNLVNGKYYIGQHITENMEDGYLGSGQRLKLAIQKYGKENFVREIIAIAESPEQLNALEAFYVGWEQVNDKNCYNLMTGGGSSGMPSKETRQKMSDAKKNISAESRQKLSDANKGKKLSPETRKKLSDANKGKKLSPETRKKLGDANKDRKLSAVTRQKISDALKGKKRSAETRQKMSDVQKGKKHSAESRQKMGDARKGENHPSFKPLSQEAKDILLSMQNFLTATPNALHLRLRRKHKINEGRFVISLFQQEMKK